MERRGFLAGAVAAGAAVASDYALAAPSAPSPHPRIGTMTLGSLITAKTLDVFSFPAFARTRLDLTNIELFSLTDFTAHTPAYIQQIRATMRAEGCRVLNVLHTENTVDMVSGDAAARARGIDIGRRWVDIAAALGSPSMRTNANYDTTLGGPDVFARVVEAYRTLADYAQTVGIRLLVENIYGYTATIDHVIEVIKAVDSPNCRGIVDWGNSAAKTSEERVSECQRLMPYVDVVSAKGRAFDAQYRHTGWDIGALVRAAEAGGFRGIYSLDVDPGPQLDQTLATRSVIATIQANLAAG